ncbi:MAG: hypothetical protein JSV03_07065 [Planctomycetota bacterium]|nr:MAG: hypothetical protein JSV03_07065 [Planctomycetota bacterium]
MSRFARVDSVDAVKELRASLCIFAEDVQVGLDEAEAEIRQTANWLKQDQHAYWKAQVRKYSELVTRAKIALKQKQQQKTPLGGRYSCVDEKKALAAAQRRFEESEQKLANVCRWLRRFDEEAFNYRGVVQGLNNALAADIPKAITQLDNMIGSLESYVSAGPPSEEPAIAGGPVSEVGRESQIPSMARSDTTSAAFSTENYQLLRNMTPPQLVRNKTRIKKPKFSWIKDCEISKSQREAVAGLDVDSISIDPGRKVVIARDVWHQSRVYLERVEPSSPSDSGWYVGFSDGRKAKGYRALRIDDLLALRPDWDEILKLPKGYLVVVDGGTVEAVIDERGEILHPAGPKQSSNESGGK